MTETQSAVTLNANSSLNSTGTRLQEIMEAFEGIGEDIQQIGKLTEEEKLLVASFIESLLRKMSPLTSSIAVSASTLPFGLAKATQARFYPTGHLVLTFEDGNPQLIDLSETKNRDLMMAVFGDIGPKLINLSQNPDEEQDEKFSEPPQIQEIPMPPAPVAPEPLPLINVETPVDLTEPAPSPAPTEMPEEPIPQETPASIFTAEQTSKIEAIKAETLEFIELLSNERFEHAPISRFFDDWMVNLRQVVLSFTSNGIISPDEEFNKQFSQIFNNIEEELAKRLLNEAELEVSTKTLEEDKNLLGKINAGYVAQTKDYVVKGKSAIDFLINNVQHLEQEIAELDKVKTSYLHPLKKLARDQKQAEITQKLNAAKKRLALAVQCSTVRQGAVGDIDAEYAAQTRELAVKRKLAINFLDKEVRGLEKELNKIFSEADSFNPIKKLTRENKIIDINLKLDAARKRLRLAEQDSGVEQKKLHEEYLKKKQAMVGQMQSLEKDIKTKEVDGSVEARKAACNALATAVKSLIERKTVPPTNVEAANKEGQADTGAASKPN